MLHYIFYESLPALEIIATMDYWHSCFGLLQEQEIGTYIMEMVVQLRTFREKQFSSKGKQMRWFYPPQFAIRAINNPVENSKDFHRRLKYAGRFKDALNSVKYILVPILEEKHWFLAYIDINEKIFEIWDSLRSKQSKRDREYAALRVLLLTLYMKITR